MTTSKPKKPQTLAEALSATRKIIKDHGLDTHTEADVAALTLRARDRILSTAGTKVPPQ